MASISQTSPVSGARNPIGISTTRWNSAVAPIWARDSSTLWWRSPKYSTPTTCPAQAPAPANTRRSPKRIRRSSRAGMDRRAIPSTDTATAIHAARPDHPPDRGRGELPAGHERHGYQDRQESQQPGPEHEREYADGLQPDLRRRERGPPQDRGDEQQ